MIATVTHVSGLFMGFIGPLVAFLVYSAEPFVRENARNALNFQLTAMIWAIVTFFVLPLAGLLGLVPDLEFLAFLGFFGPFLAFPGFMIVMVVLQVVAAMEANKGRVFTYPLTIPFLRSPR